MTFPLTAFSNCTDVLALSKETNVTVENEKYFKENINTFCSEYSKSSNRQNKRSLNASYKYISGSYGKSNMSQEEVYSSYCGFSRNDERNDYAYSKYIETLAPKAVDAYVQCMSFAESDLNFTLPQGSILPTEFSIAASFSSRVKNSTASLSFDKSDDVTCSWLNAGDETIKLESGSSASLKCNRNQYKKDSYVNIIRDNEATKPMSIPWQRYSDDGYPVNIIRDLQNELNAYTGAVIPFEETKCPNGWDVYTKAYGRFIRGIDRGDVPNNDPDGVWPAFVINLSKLDLKAQ